MIGFSDRDLERMAESGNHDARVILAQRKLEAESAKAAAEPKVGLPVADQPTLDAKVRTILPP